MHAKPLKYGQIQAARLPEQFRFEGKAVSIQKIGDSVVLSPINDNWDSFFEAAADFAPDFMLDREQGE